MNKFLEWFQTNRTSIGYTIGGLNILNGILGASYGNMVAAVFWIIVGLVIIFDTKYFK
jgi:hypothetical protein